MSRFLKVMIVLLAIAAFAAPAMAADNFSVSGQMNVFGTYQDNDDASGKTNTFGYQKLRVYGIFKAAENVTVQFRSDFSEGTWGADWAQGRLESIQDFDRAFMDIKLDAVDLRLGTQYVAFGKSQSFNYNDTGVTAVIKGEMPITLTFAVLDDNDVSLVGAKATNAQTQGDDMYYSNYAGAADNQDRLLFGANVKVADFNVFAGLDKDKGDKEVYLFGASYGADYNGLKVTAEVDFFTGDHSATVDATGLTGFVDVNTNINESTTVGGALYYAAGNDDASDMAYTGIGNRFGVWDVLTRGPFADETYLVDARPYDLFGSQAGIVAGQLYADMKASDDLLVGASVAYGEPEEDSVTTEDSKIFLSAHATYALAQNVSFINGIQYVDTDDSAANATESELSIATGLIVKF